MHYRYPANFIKLLLFSFLFSFSLPGIAALNGSYTINPAGTASSTNYKSFSAAVFDLTSASGSRPDGGPRNGPDVSGPVVFSVAAATYSEQVTMVSVAGTSIINTITFDGGAGNAASRIVTYSATSNINAHTIKLENSAFINFKNLTIRAAGNNYGLALHLYGTTSNCRISNCILALSGTGVTSTSSNYILMLANSSTNVSSTAVASSVADITADSNTFQSGYHGFCYYGNGNTGNIVLRGNVFTNQYAFGALTNGCNGLKFLNNTIAMRSNSTGSIGLYMYSSVSSAGNFHDISSNKITDVSIAFYIYFCTPKDSTVRCRLTNNMAGGGFKGNGPGILCYLTSYWDIFHNTINIDAAGTAGASCVNLYSVNGMDIRNNSFAYTAGSGDGLAFYCNNVKGIVDNNNFFKQGSGADGPLISINNMNYGASDFRGADGKNINSVNVPPAFYGVRDLHTYMACNKGAAVNVTTDIDGNTRSSAAPDIGADEVTVNSGNDAGIAQIIYPAFPLTAGTNDIKVVLKNFGSSTLTSASIHYSINGGTLQTKAWSGSLAQCDTALIVFSGSQQYNFTGGTYSFITYTSSPNGSADVYTANDTLKNSNCISLSGNYTIDSLGSGSSNFRNFAEVIDRLNCGGVSGPVVFAVAAGTNRGQIDLWSIKGTSAVNSITFDGGAGNAASRILEYDASSGSFWYTLRIRKTPYVHFRNMTIRTLNSMYGTAVHILGNSNGSTIKNCVLEIAGAGATATSSFLLQVVINDKDLSAQPSYLSYAEGIEIDSNFIKNGYGLYIYGGKNISIRNNTITDAIRAAYLVGGNGLTLTGNDFFMRKLFASEGVLIYNNVCSGALRLNVSSNRIQDAQSRGIYISNSYNPDTAVRCLFSNNMIGGGFGNGVNSGLGMSNCRGWDIVHNSIYMDSSYASGSGNAASISYSDDLRVLNNQFILNSNTQSWTAFQSYYNTFIEFDYNNYYRKPAGALLDFEGTLYYENDFRGTQGFNLNSISVPPVFIGKYDLHLKNGCFSGTPFTPVSTDYDGNSRSQTNPDMGADEVIPGSDNAGITEIISPMVPIGAGLQDIVVVLKNFGSNNLTSVNINYSVNGGSIQTFAWTGSLGTCDTALVTFTGSQQYNFTGNTFNIKVYSSVPNGVADTYPDNDTLEKQLCLSISGTFTIDPAGSGSNNFTSFNAAVSMLECGGISGPVIFNVANGTYNEQIEMSYITGSSAVNTITFRGTDSVNTILTFSGIQASPFTFRLNRAKHTRIQNMTIANTGTVYAIGIQLVSAADSNIISGCLVKMNTGATSFNITGIAVAQDNISVSANNGNGNVIRNCLVDGGGVSIALMGQSPSYCQGNVIENCRLEKAYNYGIYSILQESSHIVGNIVETRPLISGTVGMYCGNQIGLRLERNAVKSLQYGLYLANFGTGSARSSIVNNIVTNQIYPVYSSYTINTDFFHNTVFPSSTGGSGFYMQGGTGNDIRNNIFYRLAGTGTCFSLNTPSSITALDHNIYFSKGGGTLASIGGVPMSDLKAMQNAYPALNIKSLSVEPAFVSTSDLHLKASVASPAGDSTARVDIDFDNDPRCRIAPSIGADESKFIVPLPVADFTLPDTAWINSITTFYNAASAGLSEMYSWDIFNDNVNDFVSYNASYVFTNPGTYQIKLTTTNCSGSGFIVKSLVVDTPKVPPVVNFTTDLTEIDVWQSVHLLDSSLYGPTSWLWTVTPNQNVYFIPGNNVYNPEINFGEPGAYTVCLTAANAAGTSNLCKTAYIKVKYVTNLCVFPFESRATDGKIYDSGGPTGNYGNIENCTFLLNPCASSVSLSFSSFSMLSGDTLKVFDGIDSTGVPLHTGKGFTGTTIPGTLKAKTGKIFMQVKTNASAVSTGFAATWTSTPGTFPAPVASFTTNTITPYVGYENSPMKLMSTSTGVDLIYSWDIDNDGIEDFTTKNVEFTFPGPGTYYVKLTVISCGGTDVSARNITILTPAVAPLTDFIADRLIAATTDIVTLTDRSDFGPVSWNWSFSPSTVVFVNSTDATYQEPQVRFTAPGLYSITLSTANAIGTDDTTKTAYIKVVSYCVPAVTTLSADVGISRVELKGINNPSPVGQTAYSDYTGNGQYALVATGERATLKISRNTNINPMSRKAWIDFNLDGVFDNTEKVLEEGPSNTLSYATLITVPKTAVKGYARMRVATSNITDPNVACGPHNRGEFEDYRIIISADTMVPVITLIGADTVSSEIWYKFNDPGFLALDNVDGNISSRVVISSNVDTSNTGYYTITYNVTDSAGNVAFQRRRVVHITPDVTKPVITLTGGSPFYLELFTPYSEPGYAATDYFNFNLFSLVQRTGAVNHLRINTYDLTYEVTDMAGNTTSIVRKVIVRDTEKPVLNLLGPDTVIHCRWKTFVDPGYIYTDNHTPAGSSIITRTGSVNDLEEGTYVITYTAKDSSGNVSIPVARVIKVINCNVGIQEDLEKDMISIFPNPSDGIFNITGIKSLNSANIKIFNALGAEVFVHGLSHNITNGSCQLDMSALPAGVYFVRFDQQGQLISRRITLFK